VFSEQIKMMMMMVMIMMVGFACVTGLFVVVCTCVT